MTAPLNCPHAFPDFFAHTHSVYSQIEANEKRYSECTHNWIAAHTFNVDDSIEGAKFTLVAKPFYPYSSGKALESIRRYRFAEAVFWCSKCGMLAFKAWSNKKSLGEWKNELESHGF